MLLYFSFNARIEIMKKLIKFLWEDLYNKHATLAVHIYNLISASWLTFLFAYASKHPYEAAMSCFFLLFITLFYNFFVYLICHIVFIIETKKNKVMKDNPIIKSGLYRVISIFSIIIICFHYFLFAIFLLNRLGILI